MSLHQEPSEEHVEVLRRYFGHNNFKKEQWNIIRAIMYDKKDCCVIASTGFGKSLIYQYPAVYLKKLVVVISPLIALMQDQVFSLQKRGIKACFFGSQQRDKSLRMKDHNIVYITPEYIFLGNGKSALAEVRDKIALFAVDEAHVLDQWGNDFRPTYKRLHELRTNYPSVPIIALTATAPKYVENMITSTLRLRKNFYFVKTALDRPNLEFAVYPKMEGNVSQILPHLLLVTQGSAIVYCITRKDTDELAEKLNVLGIPCKPYHAGLESDVRKALVNDFRNNKVRFVICTIAFGMGIDKPDVRLVLHYGLPKSLEAFYQEAGRAGRDGKPAKCILFHNSADVHTVLCLIGNEKNDAASEMNRMQLQALLMRVVAFAKSSQCRRLEVLNYLGTTDEELEKITIRENCCDNCRRDLIYKVPSHMRYHGITEEGHYDFTTDSRLLLSVVNGKISRKEVVDHLVGDVFPTKLIFNCWNLKLFSIGKHKPSEWWQELLSLLTRHNYIEFTNNHSNIVRMNKKSTKFLRYKSNSLYFAPSHSMLSSLAEKDDVEFFWQGETIAQRPKKRAHAISQEFNRTVLDDDEDLEEIIAVCDQIESDSMLVEELAESDVQPQQDEAAKQQTVQPMEIFDEDDDFFDEAALKAIESLEQTGLYKFKVKVSCSQVLRDEKEVEDILKNFQDSDDEEVNFTAGSSKRRCHVEEFGQCSKHQKKT